METLDNEELMTTIKIKVDDQNLTVVENPIISSGDVNNDKIEFILDNTWLGFDKKAVLYIAKANTYEIPLDSDNSCIIPKELLPGQCILYIGLVGVSNDSVKTSKVIPYRIYNGAISTEVQHLGPTPDIYEQILANYNQILHELDENRFNIEDAPEEIEGYVLRITPNDDMESYNVSYAPGGVPIEANSFVKFAEYEYMPNVSMTNQYIGLTMEQSNYLNKKIIGEMIEKNKTVCRFNTDCKLSKILEVVGGSYVGIDTHSLWSGKILVEYSEIGSTTNHSLNDMIVFDNERCKSFKFSEPTITEGKLYYMTFTVIESSNTIPKNDIYVYTDKDAVENSKLNSNLTTHSSDTSIHISKEERTNWNKAKTHADSVHARTDATNVSKSYTNGNVLINGSETNVYTHPSGTNPHGTTKSDVGLGNVENKSSATIRGELTKSNVTTALGYTPLDSVLKGSTNGVAELDSNGKVPASQLPSYVDDVIEGYFSGGKFYKESSHSTVITGESGKIYIDLHTEKTYRWSGTKFSVVSETLALGETSSTAYRGDRGKTAYEHSQSSHAPSNAQANVIETVQVNGTALTPSSKSVNIEVPSKVSELINDLDLIPHNVIYIQIGDENQNGYIDYYYNGKRTRMTANTSLASTTTIRLPATGGTLALASSDKRLKDNIDDSVVNAIDLIKKIKIRQFDWNDNEENGHLMNTHQNIGFVADELEELDKRLALGGGFDEDGEMDIKTVDTFYLLGYVVKALQEIISKLDM